MFYLIYAEILNMNGHTETSEQDLLSINKAYVCKKEEQKRNYTLLMQIAKAQINLQTMHTSPFVTTHR